MKKLLVLVALVCSLNTYAAVTVFSNNLQGCVSSVASTKSCADVLAGFQLCQDGIDPNWILTTCTSDPVTVGTMLKKTYTDGTTVGFGSITDIKVACVSGTHLDTSTNTCVDDVSIAVASCMPSARTIAPCPSGFAPTNAIPSGSGGPVSYPAIFDAMPVQDVLVAIGYTLLFGLGITFGRRP